MTNIDETLRREFESDWLQGSPGEIAAYLPERSSPAYMPTLEELICIDLEFRWSRQATKGAQGDDTKPTRCCEPQMLEDYLQRFPELREPTILQRLIDQEVWARKNSPTPPGNEEYHKRFPELNLLASKERQSRHNASTEVFEKTDPAPPVRAEVCPGSFGPYRLLKLLGRGGMGSVYFAHHPETDRAVAIKIARVDGLSPEVQKEISKRFQTEIRAAAAITHDHVTPVFDAGEVHGALYYTMPVVTGDLAAEARKQPLSNERATQVIAQAARGVHAAHEAGLLHRDLKPANILYDAATDRVLIADFGLARINSAQDQMTRTNQRLGTPPYMSPEQIRGAKQCDSRTDIYSLGATLYHLLTGRPPFQAANAMETMRQVANDDPVSPRVLNPQVNKDLETICLRCLQKEPELRFQTAEALAEDLERHQRGEPIQSRRLGVVSRLLRWRRRNPAVAHLSAALTVAVLLAAVVSGLGWYSTNRQLNRVVANSREGQAALNELFTFVRTEPLLAQPGQESVREELLERGLAHYETMVKLAEENDSLPVDVVAAHTAKALLTLELHGAKPAVEQFRLAIALAEQLPEEQQQSSRVQELLGDAQNGLGQALHRSEDYQQAGVAFDEAIAVRRVLAKESTDLEPQRKLANALMNRGLTAAAVGDSAGARKSELAAQELRTGLLPKHENNAKLLRDIAQGHFNLARLDWQLGKTRSAETLLSAAKKQFESLTQTYPTDALLWQRVVECLMLQSILESQKDPTEVSPSLREAIDLLQPLVMLAPKHRTYRLRLIQLYQQATEELLAAGHPDQAEQAWQVVDGKLLSRIAAADQQPDITRLRLESMRQRAMITLAQGDRAIGKTQLTAAITAWRSAAANPENQQIQSPSWKSDWEKLQQLADSL